MGAIEALGEMQDSRAKEPLLALLQDEDQNVREYAAKALAKLGPASIDQLIAELGNVDENNEYPAVVAFRQIGAPAVEPLITALKDADPVVRIGAVKALNAIQDTRSIEPLIAPLWDVDPAVRAEVAGGLYWAGSPVVDALIAALQDVDMDVQKNAISTLES